MSIRTGIFTVVLGGIVLLVAHVKETVSTEPVQLVAARYQMRHHSQGTFARSHSHHAARQNSNSHRQNSPLRHMDVPTQRPNSPIQQPNSRLARSPIPGVRS